MASEVLMPKLGLTMTEGTVEAWHFKPGEHVKCGDVLFSVSTDKLTNDVECDKDGVLLDILVNEGESAPCKSVIAWIGQEGERIPGCNDVIPQAQSQPDPAQGQPQSRTPSAAPRQEDEFVLATPYARRLAADKGYDLARIPGSGAKGSVVSKDVESYAAGPKTSPTAARLAVDLGVDLTAIQANGRVMKADVLRAAGQGTPAAASETEKCVPVPSGNDLPPVKVDPLRRSIAANMSASWSISPRVTYTRPVDAAAMREMRAKLQPGLTDQGIKLTYNHIIMKVVAKALMEFPDVNASFADNLLTRHIHANVGLAVAKGNGLLVPNVKRCEEKTLGQIAEETQELIKQTRAGKLDAADMTGGTFTVTSLGPYGVTSFTPIINQPELAILGVCDIVDTPVVRAGEIVIRPMMNLCLTADHRVVDGVMAASFFSRICQLLEDPLLLLV